MIVLIFILLVIQAVAVVQAVVNFDDDVRCWRFIAVSFGVGMVIQIVVAVAKAYA